ncbi:TMEM165/GDT1 family protein [Nocardia sp. 2]|uniref:GDT1 family protein n=1 Tax=Nocardia acididurans TaxID=2802282 RepID=A0ABS1LYI6_9NOCA|nr:TMEM165/GDT1 family protein [Nocardia acididurans]MBL1073301.1 TMEM165/GDT1 family protein [Nocardia acididurans]
MITTILLSFGALFLAELGDKSQLMALTFALRYRWWVVLSAITVASIAVNLIAVGVGHFLGAALPTGVISLFAAAILIGVGLWTLRETLGGTGEDSETPAAPPKSRSAFFVVLSAFLLAELGDRTMFATMALATDNGWAAVWIGSVAGMVAAGGLAIFIGVTVGKRVPERLIALCSGLLFLYFGAATGLGTVATGLGTPATWTLAALLPACAGIALLALRRRAAATQPEPAASVLQGRAAE